MSIASSKNKGRGLAAACCLGVLLILASPLEATIGYSISLAEPSKHIFHVEMVIPGVSGEVVVHIPAWNTLYQIRDFSHHVMQVRAGDSGGGELRVHKLDKQSWRVEGRGTVLIRYDVFWDEGGPFASQLNREHAFFNPAMLLFYTDTRRNEDVTLTVSDAPPGWRIATALAPVGVSTQPGPWRFAAGSYDLLADAPVEVGRFEDFFLPGFQPPIRVVVHGDAWDGQKLARDLAKVCSYEIGLMGGAPYEQYLFLFHFGDAAEGAGGGMEHANSTAISTPSSALAAAIAAHEFFHLWNVKRIRPQSLEPVDYSREQWTRALWFAEGVTNTYEAYALMRAGLWTRAEFLEDLSDRITEIEERPANRWKSAEESSLDAWLEKYPLYEAPEFSVSYYSKGQVLGFLLDIVIRDSTGNHASLDDVLRAMNSDFARKGRFYDEEKDIRAEAERAAGRSLEDFFHRYVEGAEELPYEDVLARAGLQLLTSERRRPALGFRLASEFRKIAIVAEVDPGGAADTAGLKEGDQVVGWDGGGAPRRPDRWLLGHNPGDPLKLTIRRGSEVLQLAFPLGEETETVRKVVELPGASARQRAILEGLTRGTVGPRE
jgi:predicted metalloprotease with PDZ domain